MTENDWTWIGLRILDIRRQRKISLKELADRTGITKGHLSNIEHNQKHVSLEALTDVVSVLDVSMDYIVRGIRPQRDTSGLVFHSDDELEKTYLLTEE